MEVIKIQTKLMSTAIKKARRKQNCEAVRQEIKKFPIVLSSIIWCQRDFCNSFTLQNNVLTASFIDCKHPRTKENKKNSLKLKYLKSAAFHQQFMPP